MEYNFREIEKKWRQTWIDQQTYKVSNDSSKPKFYVLDMFPYPSGAGLHVGHPLGYIASDIFSRFKRLKGFNVLHPMGYDAFGLPAEQYAIEHGVHPAISTDQNINNFRKQLDNIGFSFDWDREVRTSDPSYYKWTQWIFLQLFNSYFNRAKAKAAPIAELIACFEKEGNQSHPCPAQPVLKFGADDWKKYSATEQQQILMDYRLAYCGYGEVNWCEALGTVLANDEVINGVSERGGFPVEKKKLRQWYLRITEYADRLLEGLEKIDFSDAMKEMQTNWIGKSVGAEIDFGLTPGPSPVGEGSADETQHPVDNNTEKKSSYKTANSDNWKFLKEFARKNRKTQTEAEEKLWQELRNDKLGSKVRRQHTVQDYIVDFVFLEVKLAVEVDGGYHESEEQQKFDEARTAYLNEYGFHIIRFINDEVLHSMPTVLKKIEESINKLRELKQSTITSGAATPLSPRRGAGGEAKIRVYTTRPDTIFGVDFMVIAPELDIVEKLKSPEQATAVDGYLSYVKSRSERERMAEKKITGVFTGSYAINPFDGRKIPVWISEYVLAGYGTGAIMAVPCGDERDFKFAKHFNIPITNILGTDFDGVEANPTKDAILHNSGFLNGTPMREAVEIVVKKLEEMGIGTRKTNFRMRDAAFSRQRYWGEPFPIKWINGIAYPMKESELPLELPHVDSYKPGPEGEGPLANIPAWTDQKLETNTMPGYAGSSWYFLRYMDPHNNKEFCSRKVSDYWGQVDLYIGGTEHAVGHLLYSRMWTKALYDLGHIGHDEPYKKLVNQGMIQGSSRFVYKVVPDLGPENLLNLPQGFSDDTKVYPIFLSSSVFKEFTTGQLEIEKLVVEIEDKMNSKFYSKLFNGQMKFTVTPSRVFVDYVDGFELDKDAFRNWRIENQNAVFICEDRIVSLPSGEGRGGAYICGSEVEKMSKSKFNTVNPDDLVLKYGADTFRMYEMFLGPVEISKPWDTKGIEGVHRFLKKFWRLLYDEIKGKVWTEEKANAEELKVLHKTIKKIEEDTERFSFNTAVSAFMICVNELSDLKCHKREILEPLIILLAPYAPHIAEELWKILGNQSSILDAKYPVFEPKHVTESSKEYPISVNGKLRTTLTLALDLDQADVEAAVLANEVVQKWLEGKAPKKIIFVKGKMVNVVVNH